MGTTVELLERLVAINTTSRGSNLALLEVAEEILDRNGATYARVPSPDGERANLLARVGPDVTGGVVLSAHTDCVPVTGQPWSRDPFTVIEDDGRLYGRGTADMKGFIAAALSAMPRLAGADLRRPLILALSYDEELGTLGAPSLVERLVATQQSPAAVIVGEPTSMRVVGAHKGVRAFTTRVEGLDAHSSQPHHAANAVAAAARVAVHIDELAARHRDAAADDSFDPPYTTFNLATIAGGQAINIVPRRCELTWEYRPVPADDSFAIRDEVEAFATEQVLPRLRAATGTGDITFRTDSVVPTLAPEDGGEAERLVRELTGYDGPLEAVAFGTDGGHFKRAGISTVVCGPGSIDQAHQPDEFVAVDQLAACDELMDRLASHLEQA